MIFYSFRVSLKYYDNGDGELLPPPSPHAAYHISRFSPSDMKWARATPRYMFFSFIIFFFIYLVFIFLRFINNNILTKDVDGAGIEGKGRRRDESRGSSPITRHMAAPQCPPSLQY